MMNGTYNGSSAKPSGSNAITNSIKPQLSTSEYKALVKKLSAGKHMGGQLGANWANTTMTTLNNMYHSGKISKTELTNLFRDLGLK